MYFVTRKPEVVSHVLALNTTSNYAAAAQSRHVDVCDSNVSLIGQWSSVPFLSRKNMATLAGRIYSDMEKEFKQLSK